MVRTILIPEDTHIQLDIPKEYVGKKIEITYMALDELEKNPTDKKLGSFFGIISQETAEILHEHVEQVRKEWDRDI